uniref:Glycerophosphodiester phosphodiesterase domain containing 5b n=1 Tax=Eptatretus burgeri TaxID=7764 RepID=A0A8C4NLS2_EPTBU
MVRHQPLQYYKPQVLLSCIAGFLGCRWKRYQRSNDRNYCVFVSLCMWVCLCAHKGARITLLGVYLLPLLGLYLLPLLINSPCILRREQLNPRPRIIAHRGASMRLAFHFDFYQLEQMQMCSLDLPSTDGIPFLMHDSDLRRTTNVAMVFPDRAAHRADSFNWTELQQLNAGHWFLEEDPFGNVHQLSSAERQHASSQRLPNLTGLLRIAAKGNVSLIFDLRQPPADHPFRKSWVNATVDVVLASALPQNLMLWLPWEHRDVVRVIAPRFQQVSGQKELPERLHEQHYVTVNLRYTDLAQPDIWYRLWDGLEKVEWWRFGTLRRMDPEHVALSTVVRRCNRDVNTMKKKLIFFEDGLMVSDADTAAAIDTSYVGDEMHIDGDKDY